MGTSVTHPVVLADLVTVFGVPAHPLLIHIPVVLIPLTAVGVVVSAVRPRVLQQYGWLLVAAAVLAAAGAIGATLSGAQLFETYGEPEPLRDHQRWGEITRALSVLLVLGTGLWWWYGRRTEGRGALGWVLRLTVVVVSLATLAAVTVTGHLGAQSVWGDTAAAAD